MIVLRAASKPEENKEKEKKQKLRVRPYPGIESTINAVVYDCKKLKYIPT
jgi:hypothetical protein